MQTILVIFGITGDLAQRKLLPALHHMTQAGIMPPARIVGISRREVSPADLLADAPGGQHDDAHRLLQERLSVFTMNVAAADDYVRLADELSTIRRQLGGQVQTLYYLSVPPHAAVPIAEQLGAAGLNDPATKLLLEKPFGVDLASAQEAVQTIGRYYQEPQLYRIDHYLAKEMAQNIIAFRSSNAIFRHLWHGGCIEKIDIIASEKIGIEGRAAFYEQTGALRDFLQNHLMQLLALIIMDLPRNFTPDDLPALRLQALRSLEPVAHDTFEQRIGRGQYAGYDIEAGNPESTVETFAAVTLYSHDPQWQGVPFRLATGKGLAEQTTEIRVYFRQDSATDPNLLVFHMQPREGIEVMLWAKRPGYDKTYEEVALGFDYKQQNSQPVEAYERVLLDAIASDKSLFTTADEVLASWRVLQPVLDHWAMYTDDIHIYQSGTAIEELLAHEPAPESHHH